MSETQVQARICDDQGANCQAAVWVPSTDLPVSDGYFGLEPGSAGYWEVVTGFAALMALVWGAKMVVRFALGRK
jgi:hypothetical protein